MCQLFSFFSSFEKNSKSAKGMKWIEVSEKPFKKKPWIVPEIDSSNKLRPAWFPNYRKGSGSYFNYNFSSTDTIRIVSSNTEKFFVSNYLRTLFVYIM